jgi:hypothetical protein
MSTLEYLQTARKYIPPVVSLLTFVIAAVLLGFSYDKLSSGHVSVYVTQFTSFTEIVSPTRMQGLLYDHESHEGVSAFQLEYGSDKSHFDNGTECVTDSWPDIRCRTHKIPHLYHSNNGVNGLTFTALHPLFLISTVFSITASYALVCFFMGLQNFIDTNYEAVDSSWLVYLESTLLLGWHSASLVLQLLLYYNLEPFELAGDIPAGNFIITLLVLLFTFLYQMMLCMSMLKRSMETTVSGEEDNVTTHSNIFYVQLLVTIPLLVLSIIALGPLGMQQWRVQAIYITTYVFFSALVLTNRIDALEKALKSGHYIWVPMTTMFVTYLLFCLLIYEPIHVSWENKDVTGEHVAYGFDCLLTGTIFAGFALVMFFVKYGMIAGTKYGIQPPDNASLLWVVADILFDTGFRIFTAVILILIGSSISWHHAVEH